MNCEIINVGTELLLGQGINTNARDIGIMLAAAGVDCYYQTSVGDNLERIVAAIHMAMGRADAVLLTGGLGSTEDDLTRDAVAVATKRDLIADASLEALIKDRLIELEPKATTKTLRQALIPAGSIPIRPTLGTAAGFWLDFENTFIAATPGVPTEMQHMLESDILPELIKRSPGLSDIIVSRVLKAYGLREVEVEDLVSDIIMAQTNPTIAPLITRGAVSLRLTAKARTRATADALIDSLESKVRERLGDYVFGIDSEEMEDTVGALLKNRGVTIGVAESITGGLAVSRLVNTPGSSNYVNGAIVAYANSAKTKLLGVSSQSLLNHGAVSVQVAEEMAGGIRRALAAEIGLSTTGIAGPGGGTNEKPVGLVYFSLAADDALICEHTVFHGSRDEIRFKASQYLLNMLRMYLLNKTGRGDETA